MTHVFVCFFFTLKDFQSIFTHSPLFCHNMSAAVWDSISLYGIYYLHSRDFVHLRQAVTLLAYNQWMFNRQQIRLKSAYIVTTMSQMQFGAEGKGFMSLVIVEDPEKPACFYNGVRVFNILTLMVLKPRNVRVCKHYSPRSDCFCKKQSELVL